MARFALSFFRTSTSYWMYCSMEIWLLTKGNKYLRVGGQISSYFMARQAQTSTRESMGMLKSSGFDNACMYFRYSSKARKRVLCRNLRVQCILLNTINTFLRPGPGSYFKGLLRGALYQVCWVKLVFPGSSLMGWGSLRWSFPSERWRVMVLVLLFLRCLMFLYLNMAVGE